MKKILFVEDEKPLSLLYEEELTKEGYQVTVANDADAALEELRKGSFDLIVTELKAAAIDVVAAAGAESGVPTVLCDNVPEATDGQDYGALIAAAANAARERGKARRCR